MVVWWSPISPQARTAREVEEKLVRGKQSSEKSRRYRLTEKLTGQEMEKGAGEGMLGRRDG